MLLSIMKTEDTSVRFSRSPSMSACREKELFIGMYLYDSISEKARLLLCVVVPQRGLMFEENVKTLK
jgi:hypothetical protein